MKHIGLAIFLLLSPLSIAAPRVLVIGDSMSEEYSFEIPFSAPENDPLDANTQNWIESLDAHRSGQIDFGSYASNIAAYPDVRNGGYKYNWSIPGADTDQWQDVVTSTFFNQPGFLTSRWELEDQLNDDNIDVVVIFIGGNDVRAIYGSLYNNAPPSDWISDITDNLKEVIDFIQGENSSLPIILCTIPDVGATPKKQETSTDPALRQIAAGHMQTLNTAVVQLATSEGAILADIAKLTSDILKDEDYYIGGTLMIKGADPNNAPHYLFCRDGFHPATAAQAVIANTILEQINIATSSTIDPIEDRDIISDLLFLNPDQPYLEWIASFPISANDMLEDPDGDGLPNIGEYALGTSPDSANSPYSMELTSIDGTPHFLMTYPVSEQGIRLVSIINEHSSNLTHWDELPAASNVDLGNGDFQIQDPAATFHFYRQSFQLKP